MFLNPRPYIPEDRYDVKKSTLQAAKKWYDHGPFNELRIVYIPRSGGDRRLLCTGWQTGRADP